MEDRLHNKKSKLIEFDDNNIEHVTSGPEYGQPWRGKQQVWEEIESDQFVELVEQIQNSIRARRIRI